MIESSVCAVTRNRQKGEMVSLADDLKAAATDALKKCATMLGVGLHLYGGQSTSTQHSCNGHYQKRSSAAAGNGNNSHQPAKGNGGGNGNGNGRLTGKQYRYMLQLNENQGSTKADLDQQCQEMFGVVTQHLSKADASALIEQLLAH